MPAKRRWPKQRVDRAAQFAAWKMLLECGYDYLGSLKEIGLDERTLDPTLAEAAWKEFGSEIMLVFEPSSYRPQPWGLVKFGPPP